MTGQVGSLMRSNVNPEFTSLRVVGGATQILPCAVAMKTSSRGDDRFLYIPKDHIKNCTQIPMAGHTYPTAYDDDQVNMGLWYAWGVG